MPLGNEMILVEMAKNGDKDAFVELYDFYYPKILKFCTVKTMNIGLSHDLTSQTFFKVLKNIYQYKKKSCPFGSWLYKIALNEIRSYFRKNKNNTVEISEVENFLAKDDWLKIFTEKLDLEIKSNKALQNLKHLDSNDQDLIILRYIEEKNIDEICDIKNKKAAAVRTAISRAINKLRILIDEKSHPGRNVVLEKNEEIVISS